VMVDAAGADSTDGLANAQAPHSTGHPHVDHHGPDELDADRRVSGVVDLGGSL
jgi:hypothetical protein